jgi:hypothetical protein
MSMDNVVYTPPPCIRCGINPRRPSRSICLTCTQEGARARQEEIVAREREDSIRYAEAQAQARREARQQG